MRYRVQVTDWLSGGGSHECKDVRNVSLAKAWRIVRRVERRALKQFGNLAGVRRDNWGTSCVSPLFARYRSAVITLEPFH